MFRTGVCHAMNRLPLFLTVSFAALAAAPGVANAQNFYLGLGVERGDTSIDPVDVDGEMTNVAVFGGVRLSAGNFFFGGEGETSLSTEVEFDGGGSGDIDRASRLRALAGYDFGQISIFGAAGGTWISDDDAIGDDVDGWNYGVGGEFDFNDRFSARLEYIHDEGEFFDGNYEWSNDALRAGAIVKF
jgi:opacity protein-like surface antigen